MVQRPALQGLFRVFDLPLAAAGLLAGWQDQQAQALQIYHQLSRLQAASTTSFLGTKVDSKPAELSWRGESLTLGLASTKTDTDTTAAM
jgi:hypothetical protein